MEDAGQADGAEQRERYDAPAPRGPVNDQRVAGSSAQSAERAESGSDHDAIMRRLTLALVVWTAALVFVGVVAAAISYNQFRIMRDQLTEMRGTSAQTERAIAEARRLADQGDQQLKQAVRLADASQQTAITGATSARNGTAQLATSQDSEQRQLRAYVNIVDERVEAFAPGSKASFVLTVRNSGSTPATQIRQLGVTYLAAEAGKYQPISTPPTTAQVGTIAAGGSSSIIGHSAQTVTSEQVEAVKSGKAAFVTQGAITYRDAFGHLHSTNYRYVLTGEEGVTRGILLPADTGNGSD